MKTLKEVNLGISKFMGDSGLLLYGEVGDTVWVEYTDSLSATMAVWGKIEPDYSHHERLYLLNHYILINGLMCHATIEVAAARATLKAIEAIQGDINA